MPQIQRERIPAALMAHLVRRIRERHISTSQLGLLAQWLDTDPEVPENRWFKRFPEMTVCGEGELVKTFLTTEQAPTALFDRLLTCSGAKHRCFKAVQTCTTTKQGCSVPWNVNKIDNLGCKPGFHASFGRNQCRLA